jgi:hypothetical protein
MPVLFKVYFRKIKNGDQEQYKRLLLCDYVVDKSNISNQIHVFYGCYILRWEAGWAPQPVWTRW